MDLFCSENYSLQAVNFQKRVNYLSSYRKIYMRMCICLIGWKNDTGKEPWLRLGTLWFVLLIVFPRGNSHWLTVRDLTWQSAPCEKTPYLSCYQGCFIVMLISALTDTVKSLFLIAENTVITPRAKKVSPVWNCCSYTHRPWIIYIFWQQQVVEWLIPLSFIPAIQKIWKYKRTS